MADLSRLVPIPRVEHYQWRNSNDVHFKRGPALIFTENKSQLSQDFSEALRGLEFQPQFLDLCHIKETLSNGIYLVLTCFLFLKLNRQSP